MNQTKKENHLGVIIVIIGSIVIFLTAIIIFFKLLTYNKTYTEKEVVSCMRKESSKNLNEQFNKPNVSKNIVEFEREYEHWELEWENFFVQDVKNCLGVKSLDKVYISDKSKSFSSYVEDERKYIKIKEKEIIDNSGLNSEKIFNAYRKLIANLSKLKHNMRNLNNINMLAKYANVKPYIFFRYTKLHATELKNLQTVIQEALNEKIHS